MMHLLTIHIWQSSIVAFALSAAALSLRKAPARVRYRLWLLASLKFLLPCSLLIELGLYLRPTSNVKIAESPVAQMIREISRPVLAIPDLSLSSDVVGQKSNGQTALVLLWLAGCLSIVLFWAWRLARIQSMVRNAAPLGVWQGIPIMTSPGLFEPGVLGIIRPVLVVPEGIQDRLTRPQFEAILAHEGCHIRRHDNIAAAIHMVVEALFWFHPLVWWLGVKLSDEREKACDEEVVRLGSDPKVYAEAILEVCKYCIQWPLPCTAGVTGTGNFSLRKRVEYIVSHAKCKQLTPIHRVTLFLASGLVIAVPVVAGLMGVRSLNPQLSENANAKPARNLEFEVASIRPTPASDASGFIHSDPAGGLRARGLTVKLLIQNAYDLKSFQVIGLPSWAETVRYDISAKAEDPLSTPPDERKPRLEGRMRSLLTERFKLAAHESTKDVPIYELVVGKNGKKLKPSDQSSASSMSLHRGILIAHSLTIPLLAANLSNQVGRTVEDKTGLAGTYDFTLRWTPDQNHSPMMGNSDIKTDDSETAPSLFTAVQEQLGLKLQPAKGPVPVLVIDHVEKPSEN